MPNATIYIKRENEKKWKSIQNKSDFVNNLLQSASLFNERFIKNSNGICRNGHSIPQGREKCLGKGCKYS